MMKTPDRSARPQQRNYLLLHFTTQWAVNFFYTFFNLFIDLDSSASKCSTVWGGRLRKRFCNMFSVSSTGSWAELQLPCCPSKQGELPKIYNKTFYTPCRPRLATLCTISDLFSFAHHSNTRRRSQAKRVSTQVTLFMRLVALKYRENGKKSARLV